jgi:hypothetical protein
MHHPHKYIFRGNASALTGRIYRPKHIILDGECAASLTVAGGRSQSRVGPKRFGEIVSFGSAFTSAIGVFDDTEAATDMTDEWDKEHRLSTTTTVSSELEDLVIGIKPQLTIHRLRGSLRAMSPDDRHPETPITVEDDTGFEGVSVDGHRLVIELNKPLFRECNTLARLLEAAADKHFVREHERHLFATGPGRLVERLKRHVDRCSVVHGTIVKSIQWRGKPYPGAKIERNVLTIPDIGTVSFGDLLLGKSDRRLTMIRFHLGSPDGGSGAGGQTCGNGGPPPPP